MADSYNDYKRSRIRPSDGSVAYDYGAYAEPEETFYEYPLPGEGVRTREPNRQKSASRAARGDNAAKTGKNRHRAAERNARTQTISPVAVIGMILAAALLVSGLLTQKNLSAVTNDILSLESQLKELKVQNNRLVIEHEKAFNFAEIEQFAVTELGMRKPGDSQIFYIDGAAYDKTEVLAAEDNGFLSRLTSLLTAAAGYIAGANKQ